MQTYSWADPFFFFSVITGRSGINDVANAEQRPQPAMLSWARRCWLRPSNRLVQHCHHAGQNRTACRHQNLLTSAARERKRHFLLSRIPNTRILWCKILRHLILLFFLELTILTKLWIKTNEPASQPNPNLFGTHWGKQIFMTRGGSVTEIDLWRAPYWVFTL